MATIEQILGRKPIHPFPARMAPSIALEAVAAAGKNLRVLDPMAGSGTVLAVAKAQGHRAVGIDCDPLAVLNAGVWTRPIDHAVVLSGAQHVLSRAAKIHALTPIRDCYPRAADQETRRFLRYWFDQCARRELFALSTAVGLVKDDAVRHALWCAFSRMIIAKRSGVSLAMDLSHSRPHKVYAKAPVRPFEQFIRSAEEVVVNCLSRRQGRVGPATKVRLGDCRHLPYRRQSFDLVVTSPPYLNAIDYMRCSKFSLVWMGYRIETLRKIRGESVGTESTDQLRADDRFVANVMHEMSDLNRVGQRTRSLLSKYVSDLVECVSEVSRVLRTGGGAVFVIGDNQIREVFIRNSIAIRKIAEKVGLAFESEYTRELPPNRRYLPPPSSDTRGSMLQARMRSEVVLSFTRIS